MIEFGDLNPNRGINFVFSEMPKRTDAEEIEIRLERNVLMIQEQSPNISICGRCWLPWSHCTWHSVTHSADGIGSSAMCEWCWNHSSVDERLTIYKALWYHHRSRYSNSEPQYSLEDVERTVLMECNEPGSSSKFYFERAKQH